MSEELRPCPFCGEKLFLDIDEGGGVAILHSLKEKDCFFLSILEIEIPVGTTLEQMIEKINRRPIQESFEHAIAEIDELGAQEAERKEFCPNCEKDTECIHAAELYECQECGDDFAKYIVPRTAPCAAVNEPSNSDVSMTQDVLTDIKTPRSIENNNPDYYKAAEKTALVRLCGVLGVLTENNDLATAALLAATRIERLEKKIPALNVDLAEASMHAYNGEVARMKLEAENARLTAELAELNDKAVFIQFENEDELPADISNDVYSTMFNCSHVDGVRLFPYIEENGQKYFLVMLREDE